MSREEVTNSELFLWALHRRGGGSRFVDVEEVFLECFSLAPARLSWRTRPDLPDYKKCSKGLRDAESRRPALLVKTKDGYKRQLTVEGVEWIKANARRLGKILDGKSVVPEPKRRPRTRLLAEARQSQAFSDWKNKEQISEKKWLVADLFRCSPDSAPDLWRERLEVLRNAAYATDPEFLDFLNALHNEHHDWFGD